MNQKNTLELDKCFLNTNDPIELFKTWMNKAKETEPDFLMLNRYFSQSLTIDLSGQKS